jgi:hypothetical protein
MADKAFGKDEYAFRGNPAFSSWSEYKQALSPEALDGVAGGVLPEGWEEMAAQMAPMLKAQYPNATYEEACEMLKSYVDDPDDYATLCDYIKIYF